MMPRSGAPEMFESLAEYETYVGALVDAKIIPDATYIWWALRPSLKHPTLELRICDSCTSIDDAVAIASLYRALIRHLLRRPEKNPQLTAINRALAEENRWRAQRYGIDGTLIDESSRKAVSCDAVLEELLFDLKDDIDALGVQAEIQHLITIGARGTSAHQQLSLYRALRRQRLPPKKSMRGGSKWLLASTEAGDFAASDPYGASVANMANGSRSAGLDASGLPLG